MPTGLGVRYRSSGRSKWKSRIDAALKENPLDAFGVPGRDCAATRDKSGYAVIVPFRMIPQRADAAVFRRIDAKPANFV